MFAFSGRRRHVNPNEYAIKTALADRQQLITAAFDDRRQSHRDTATPVVGEQSLARRVTHPEARIPAEDSAYQRAAASAQNLIDAAHVWPGSVAIATIDRAPAG